ncbi:MAG: LarC family nickel insertion protein [Bacillota bacterium]
MNAYFDIFSGISGNMVLGALLDLGLDYEEWKEELKKLGLEGEYNLINEKAEKHGIGGRYFQVELVDNKAHGHNHQHEDDHDHHSHEDHAHDHDHDHEHSHHDHSEDGHSHEHGHSHGRNLEDINKIIDNSGFSSNVKEKAKAIFLNLAKAEAKIHGEDINEIHFHEVGAVDAIVDIVGSVLGLEMLGIDKIYSSKLHTGTGFVNCDHGKMPVPAPATMELLEGIPVYSVGIEAEMVTPTGAAIISTLAESFGARKEMKIIKSGYGAGSRDLPIPNLLRVNLIEDVEKSEQKKTQ